MAFPFDIYIWKDNVAPSDMPAAIEVVGISMLEALTFPREEEESVGIKVSDLALIQLRTIASLLPESCIHSIRVSLPPDKYSYQWFFTAQEHEEILSKWDPSDHQA